MVDKIRMFLFIVPLVILILVGVLFSFAIGESNFERITRYSFAQLNKFKNKTKESRK